MAKVNKLRSSLAIAGKILGIVVVIIVIVIDYLISEIPSSADRTLYKDRTNDPTHRVIKVFLRDNKEQLELYKRNNGRYPNSLEQVEKDRGYRIVLGLAKGDRDNTIDKFYYFVTKDGQSYDLRWLGLDGQYNTADDVLAP